MDVDTDATAPFVVALGASADGLGALERFFDRVSPRSGMAFVVIQHLSADFDSHLVDILSRHTELPVRVATHGARLEPDTVYLNPPAHVMSLEHGHLQLAERDRSTAVTHSIDRFFHSMAADAPGRCAAIVLSGAGADGARGVIDVHRAGGPEALARLAGTAAPDLILLDLGLPGMDGLEVCRRMRALPGGDSLLILALTGFGQDSDREATRQAGFDGHLTKPVEVEDVYAAYARCRSMPHPGA